MSDILKVNIAAGAALGATQPSWHISYEDLEHAAKLALILVTLGYTAWKWYHAWRKSQKRKNPWDR